MGNNKRFPWWSFLTTIMILCGSYFHYTAYHRFNEVADISLKQQLMLKKSNELMYFILSDSNYVDVKTLIKIKEIVSYQQAIIDAMNLKNEE